MSAARRRVAYRARQAPIRPTTSGISAGLPINRRCPGSWARPYRLTGWSQFGIEAVSLTAPRQQLQEGRQAEDRATTPATSPATLADHFPDIHARRSRAFKPVSTSDPWSSASPTRSNQNGAESLAPARKNLTRGDCGGCGCLMQTKHISAVGRSCFLLFCRRLAREEEARIGCILITLAMVAPAAAQEDPPVSIMAAPSSR